MGSSFGGSRFTGVLGAKFLGSVSCCIGLVGSVMSAGFEVSDNMDRLLSDPVNVSVPNWSWDFGTSGGHLFINGGGGVRIP